MPKFIVIEVDENEDYEIQADYIRNVAQLVDDGFICGYDKPAKFESVTTLNHATMNDVRQLIKGLDKWHLQNCTNTPRNY